MKLMYFNARGRAEATRLMLAYAGKEYEDCRIEGNWEEVKPTTKWGSMPQLEVDGLILGQSNSVQRYVALTNNLGGQGVFEQYQVDMVIDTVADIFDGLIKAFSAPNEEEKAKLHEEFVKSLPRFFGILEKILADNGGEYMVGSSLTAADIAMYHTIFTLCTMEDVVPVVEESAKNLKALHDRVAEIPSIKSYVEKRPESSF